MHTFLYSALQTSITWNKACKFNDSQSNDPLTQYFSVWNTAAFVKATLPSTLLTNCKIQVLSVGSAALAACTNQSHSLEKLVQVTQIAMTGYTIIFGSNKERAAILCIAIIIMANRSGLIPTELAKLSNRFNYMLAAVTFALSFKTKSRQATGFIAAVSYYEVENYLNNYDPFPKTGPASAIDWCNFYEKSSDSLRKSMRKAIESIPFNHSFLYAPCGIEQRDEKTTYDLYQKTLIFIYQNYIFTPASFKELTPELVFKSAS